MTGVVIGMLSPAGATSRVVHPVRYKPKTVRKHPVRKKAEASRQKLKPLRVTAENFDGLSYFTSDGSGRNWSVLFLRFNRSAEHGSLGPGWTYQEWQKGKQVMARFGSLPDAEFLTVVRLLQPVALSRAAGSKSIIPITSGKASGMVLTILSADNETQTFIATTTDAKLAAHLTQIIQRIKAEPEEPVSGDPGLIGKAVHPLSAG